MIFRYADDGILNDSHFKVNQDIYVIFEVCECHTSKIEA